MSEKERISIDDEDDLADDLEIGVDEAEAGSLAPWIALFNFTNRSHIISLLLASFLSIASGVVAPALALLLGKVFDEFSDYGSQKIESHEFGEKVAHYSIALCGLGVASGVLKGAFYGCWLAFGEIQAAAARQELFADLSDKEMEWFDMRRAGIETLIARLQTQIRDLQYATSQPLGFVTQCVATILVALGLSFYYSWGMTLITLAAVPLTTIFLAWISARIQPHVEDHIKVLTTASRVVTVSISEIDAVKTLNGQTYEIARYTKVIIKAAKSFLAQAHGNAAQIGFCRLITLSMFVQGFWYGSHLVHQGKHSTGDIVTAFMSALIAAEAVEHVLPQLIVLEKGRAAAGTLKMTQLQVERGRRIGRLIGTMKPSKIDGSMELKHICFSYPSMPGKMVLNDVNLSFAAGETTFVVGRSGSGKSTIANLLLGLYRPGSGQVLVDGRPIQILDMDWLRRSIGLCQQQSILFNETFRQNVVFGSYGRKSLKETELTKAIDFACLRSLVDDLPFALDTKLGSGGTSLSGGQQQRVALARTRLKNAPVLVLDEATSALDQMTKFIIFDNIRKWRRGKTTIIITHDLEQILEKDYVYVLDGGRLSQQGYRHELRDIPRALVALESHPRITPPRIPGTFSKMWEGLDESPTTSREHATKSRRKSSIVSSLFIAPGAISSQLSGLSGLSLPLSPRSGSIDIDPKKAFGLPSRSTAHMNIIDVIEMKDLDRLKAHKTGHMWSEQEPRIHCRSSFHVRSASGMYRRLSTASTIVTDATHRASVSGYKKAQQASAIIDILATVWPSLTARHRALLFLGFGSATLHSAAVPAFSWAFARLLGTIIIIDTKNGSPETRKWSLILLGITIIDAMAFYSMHYLLQICGQAWIDAIRKQAFRRVLDQPRAWFEVDQNSVSRLADQLDRNAEEMRGLLGRFAGFVYVAATMLIISIVWSMVLSWKFTMVGLATMPAIYILTRAFEIVSGRWENKGHESALEVSRVYHETFVNFRIVLAFTLKPHFLAKCTTATKAALHVGMRRSLYTGLFFGLSDSIFLYVIALILWFGAHLASKTPSSLENILSALTILLLGISNVNAAVAYIPQIGSARTMADQLLRLARLPYQSSHEHTGHAQLKSIEQISFSSVSLIYPSRPAFPALTDLTVNLRCDRTTALVGFSGSGKSSIASLIMGLYPSTSGSITVDHVPLRNISMQSLRSLVAIVPQRPTLFPATVLDNVSYALPEGGSLSSLANAKRAAKLAGIDEYIMTLPQGYNTVLGPGGAGLSGGQQQRIAIARAIARRPKYLILDEATSGLDDQTAQCIRNTIRLLAREGTGVLVITHHKKMMEICEEVMVMREGRVVEQGAFAELRQRRDGSLRKLLGE